MRSLSVCASLLVGTLLGNSALVAQQSSMGGMTMGTTKDGMVMLPPPESLPVPVHMTGIGNSHITIKATPEAQVWFDQGLTLQHDFWDYEAQKAFEQGIRVDPQCAMCYWGLAEAEGFRHSASQSYGKKALAKAVELKKHASGSDKLYIEAAEAGSKDGPDADKAEIELLRKLVKKYPKDTQAKIFLANAVGDGYDDKGEPKAGEKEAIAILEGVMKESPNDSAANHYWIHAMEPGNHPERAIPSAALLASLAPTSGHMVHMPGHIYYRVGDYKDADVWFAASTAADEKYMRDQHVGPDDDWNYVHNMMYGIANLMEQGRFADANALSDRLAGARGQLSATLYVWSARDQMARVSRRLPVALRVGDWNGVLAMLDAAVIPETEKTANLRFMTAELGDLATGMLALDKDDVAGAKAASARFDAGLWRVKQDKADAPAKKDEKKKDDAAPMEEANPDAMEEPLVQGLSVASLELRAGVLVGEKKLDAAKKIYTQAVGEEKKLGYHEPPFYIRPVHETEAAALLKARDYAGAKTAYESALIDRPDSGFELYGIARSEELAGHTAEARKEYEAFLKAWPTADPGLPQVEKAKAILATRTAASNL